jgi:N-ethylmaleimide reductase
MTRHPALFTPVPLGQHTLRNRIVLPPQTASAPPSPETCRPR